MAEKFEETVRQNVREELRHERKVKGVFKKLGFKPLDMGEPQSESHAERATKPKTPRIR